MASPAPDAVSSQERSTLAAKCPEHVLQAIYGKTAEKRKVYEQSLNSWWAEYAARKNDEEDEHVADSLLYDLNHLPRAAPPPEWLLERPGLDQLQPEGTPATQSGLGSSDTVPGKKLGGGAYRVLLLDSLQHTEKLVVHVITQVVVGTSQEHALNCYNTACKLGQAIITSCLKEHAEFYALQMAKNGVRCTIEPDSTVI
ncbi:hypothetical protein WJX81_001774 [Elliptochloris bilobata]|uniref:Uncharacterized protein n=1 Tax=Elliptochloris bilobata TaxID=381761 RepID=A0AAW1QJB3_9CHLO